MDSKKAQSCLKTFLEVSKLTIASKDRQIKCMERKKSICDVAVKKVLNERITAVANERNKIQGRLDSVRLEMLDMILDNPSLVSEKLISKKGYDSVVSFVKGEKETIELRGLYQEYPCSIAEVLNVALSGAKEESLSPFDRKQTEATDSDIKSAVNDAKVVKTMIKSK